MVRNRIGDTLVVTFDPDTDAATLGDATSSIAADVHRLHTRRVVFDLGAVEILDSVDMRSLVHLARTVELLGARPVVAGLRPQIVGALTMAGLDLHGIEAALDVGQAMSWERHGEQREAVLHRHR